MLMFKYFYSRTVETVGTRKNDVVAFPNRFVLRVQCTSCSRGYGISHNVVANGNDSAYLTVQNMRKKTVTAV